MRIAQIAPLYESVPPRMYGGTERVVSYLTEELVKQGHQVTLFGSGDSRTSARLVSHIDTSLRLNSTVTDPFPHHIIQLQQVIEQAHNFDILHFHTDYFHFPFSGLLKNVAIATTLHGRLDLLDLQYVYNKFKGHVISISDAQRRPLPQANWLGTVYHGLPKDLYKQGSGDGDYVIFLGRISPEKRPDRAIEIARRAGLKIKIAAKVDKVDQAYYNDSIRDLIRQPHVDFMGEVGEDQKGDLLGKAKALLFPIDWPEPFGMVIVEAMACGTPVIAYPHGSVPELISEGENGFVVNNIDRAVEALDHVDLIDRERVREIFEERFSSTIMVNNYVRLYEKIVSKEYAISKIRI